MLPVCTPSTIYNGFELAIVPIPRIVTFVPAPGAPLFLVIEIPGAIP